MSDPAKKIWALRIVCADAWPGLIDQCVEAVGAVRPGNKVRIIQRVGCVEVNSHSKHWPCLFVRGLLHSDGCRFVNRVRRPLKDGERWYEYPRSNFTNVSPDILELFTGALDRLGIAWTRMNEKNISVAKKGAVARLDEFVGPKS